MNELVNALVEATLQHIPNSGAWVVGSLAATILVGVITLAKGARFAPVVAALAFMGVGGVGGSFIAHWIGTPVWVTMGCGAVVGFIAGLALFRVWLAILVGACFAIGSLSVYSVRVLQQPLVDYANRPIADGGVTLRTPDQTELPQIWSYLSESVPNFQTSTLAITLSTLAAGIVFGLLLPKLSRALWAASAGTLFFFAGALQLLGTVAPEAHAWLMSIGPWGLAIIGGVWTCSLVYNLYDCRDPRPKKTLDNDEPKAKAALA